MKTIATIAKTATFAIAAGAVALGLAGPVGAASGTMYGDPAAAAKWWRHQKYDDCVLMASADVIGQVTGKEPSEAAIITKAQSIPSVVHPGTIYTKPANTKNPNSGMGTSFADVPALLAEYKIGAVVTNKKHAAKDGLVAGMEGIEQQLGAGHQVIVSVNAELIWHWPVETKDDDGNPDGTTPWWSPVWTPPTASCTSTTAVTPRAATRRSPWRSSSKHGTPATS